MKGQIYNTVDGDNSLPGNATVMENTVVVHIMTIASNTRRAALYLLLCGPTRVRIRSAVYEWNVTEFHRSKTEPELCQENSRTISLSERLTLRPLKDNKWPCTAGASYCAGDPDSGVTGVGGVLAVFVMQ